METLAEIYSTVSISFLMIFFEARISNENPVAKEKDFALEQENRDTNVGEKKKRLRRSLSRKKNYGGKRAM